VSDESRTDDRCKATNTDLEYTLHCELPAGHAGYHGACVEWYDWGNDDTEGPL
jgi:hypothetical protein